MEEQAKVERTEDQIAAECARLLTELGQRQYQAWLTEREIDALQKKIYALNVEAYKLKASKIDQEASNG